MDRAPLTPDRQASERDGGAWARWLALAAAILLSVLLGMRAATPPAPLSALAPRTLFSATRAMADVRTVAQHPHPTGSAANGQVRDYLVRRLTSLGLKPETRHYMIDPASLARLHNWSGGSLSASELVDIVGVLPGRDRSLPALLLMAHYDTVWGSPGGGDDSIGLAAVLEMVRALKARGPMARDVVVLFTDGEEIGLSGAKAFWSGDPLVAHIGAVINLEARGAGGRATMFETGADNGPMMRLFARSVAHPVANSLTTFAYKHMPNDTDFTVSRAQGLPGFNFAILGRAAYYHSPRATADRLDPGSLQDMGAQALDIAAALASGTTLPEKGPDTTFFDVGGHSLILYSAAKGWWVAIGAAGLLVLAWIGAFRGGMRAGEAGPGLLAVAWLLVHGLLALTSFNLLSGAGPHANDYDRLAALPRLEALAYLLCLAIGAGFMMLRRAPKRWYGLIPALALAVLGILTGGQASWLLTLGILGAGIGFYLPAQGVSRWGGWLAGLLTLALLALVFQKTLPAGAWVIGWPTLLMAAAAALVAWTDPGFRHRWTPLAPALALVLIGGPLLAIAHAAFDGLGISTPQLLLVPLLILVIGCWPLAQAERWHRSTLLAIAAMIVAAGALALHVRVDPMADTVPAYSLER